MSNLVHLVLERDGHDQPWGFRLQGGADVGLPLSVQRVLVGTPAEGTFFKGDVIQKVSYTDTKGLSHQQAADLFDNAGNQIHVYVKRAGVVAAPAAAAPAAAAAASAPLVNGGVAAKPAPVAAPPPVSGGVALPGIAAVAQTTNCDLPDSTTPTPAMSIQSQPHKFNPDLGVGSVQHLKMQDEHITGVKEPSNLPSQAEVAKQKANELLMKEKVRSTSVGFFDRIEFAKQNLGVEEAPLRRSGSRVGIIDNKQGVTGKDDRRRGVSLPAFDKKDLRVFAIGGEVIELNKTPARKAVSLQPNTKKLHTYILRKCSLPPRVPNIEPLAAPSVKLRHVEKRKRKVGFVLSPIQYEEHSEEITIEPYYAHNTDFHVDPECENQVTGYTLEMKVPGIDPTYEEMEVEFTLNLTEWQQAENGYINGDSDLTDTDEVIERVMEEVEKIALGTLDINDNEEVESKEMKLRGKD